MSQVIIFKQDSGRLSIITPTTEVLASRGILALALKDVPAGKPFRIIDSADLPTDLSQRNAWTCSDADLTDGVGAESSEFPQE